MDGPSDVKSLEGLRVATSYPGVLAAELARAGVRAEIVKLDGAVENAVALGVADAVADVVDTGSTLHKAGLAPIGDALMVSEGLLVRPDSQLPSHAGGTFIRRLDCVIAARA